MTLVGWAQIALVLVLVSGCAIPLSKFIADVYAGERSFLSPVLRTDRARLLPPGRG